LTSLRDALGAVAAADAAREHVSELRAHDLRDGFEPRDDLGMLLLYPQTRVHVLIVLGFWIDRIVLPAYFMLFYWFFLQVIGGIPTLRFEGGGVAFWAHVGGFVAGAVLIFVFRDPRRVAAHRAMLLRHAD